jgi:DNA-binding CsgD family transcriptional regulator/tetratricopeptide (TPR) repeat protein
VLLEREEPLALLERALARAREGHGHTFLIGGEAGIGKTSLLEYFAAERAANARVLWGACEALATPRPLGPLVDMAEEMQGSLLDALRSNRPPHELFQGFLNAVRSHDGPTVVVVEDAHWADDASAEFLKFVARRIARYPALLAVTYRDDEVSPRHPIMRAIGDVPADHLTQVRLRRLSPSGVERLAKEHRRSIPNLYALSEGNPFLATELVRSEEPALSATLRGAVLARLERLGSAAREVAELVSVVPDRMERRLLDRAAIQDLRAVQECVDLGLLLLDPDQVRYRHELSRQVVEGSLAEPRRRELNARMLALLADESADAKTLSRLVHYADAARDAASVLRHAPLAADQAAKRGAHRQAVAFYRTAIRYADHLAPRERATLLDRLAVEAFSGDLQDEALDANERAFALWREAGDTFAQGRNRRLRFEFGEYANYGERAAFAQVLESAVGLLEPHGRSTDLAMAYVDWAFVLSLRGRHDDAQAAEDKAVAMAEALADPYALSHVLLLAERRRNSFIGVPDLERTRRALDLASQSGDEALAAQAWALYATFARSAGDLGALGRALAEGLRFVEERDFDWQRMILLAQQSWDALLRGNWDAVPGIAAEVLAKPQLPGLADYFANTSVALVRCRRGEPDGIARLERACAVSDARLTAPAALVNTRSTLAEAYWLAGERDVALGHARQAFERAREMASTARHFGVEPIWSRGARISGWWLWREAGAEMPLDAEGPIGLQLRGDWRAAAGIWHEMGFPYHRAMALIDGDEPARREAFAILEKLGAAATIERCREMLAERGVRGIPRGPRAATRANPLGLTEREVEVLLLLERGLANPEISRRLHRSVKTVGHHVSAILAKLGASSRQEAAHIARSKGLLER